MFISGKKANFSGWSLKAIGAATNRSLACSSCSSCCWFVLNFVVYVVVVVAVIIITVVVVVVLLFVSRDFTSCRPTFSIVCLRCSKQSSPIRMQFQSSEWTWHWFPFRYRSIYICSITVPFGVESISGFHWRHGNLRIPQCQHPKT